MVFGNCMCKSSLLESKFSLLEFLVSFSSFCFLFLFNPSVPYKIWVEGVICHENLVGGVIGVLSLLYLLTEKKEVVLRISTLNSK